MEQDLHNIFFKMEEELAEGQPWYPAVCGQARVLDSIFISEETLEKSVKSKSVIAKWERKLRQRVKEMKNKEIIEEVPVLPYHWI